jgi:hypothetical protein
MDLSVHFAIWIHICKSQLYYRLMIKSISDGRELACLYLFQHHIGRYGLNTIYILMVIAFFESIFIDSGYK